MHDLRPVFLMTPDGPAQTLLANLLKEDLFRFDDAVSGPLYRARGDPYRTLKGHWAIQADRVDDKTDSNTPE